MQHKKQNMQHQKPKQIANQPKQAKCAQQQAKQTVQVLDKEIPQLYSKAVEESKEVKKKAEITEISPMEVEGG